MPVDTLLRDLVVLHGLETFDNGLNTFMFSSESVGEGHPGRKRDKNETNSNTELSSEIGYSHYIRDTWQSYIDREYNYNRLGHSPSCTQPLFNSGTVFLRSLKSAI
ncbi:hypothetical protein AVEN_240492-1 [Araneus ventricosus]|uniref:Uncharacterized protein n=1 Tax=Araneus ventricosus TaxID=182803 RepID=A0A4Y2HMM1_ARAVE|nr:hypothetical protein AVEN_240492-1 [Araneus ventricosus]